MEQWIVVMIVVAIVLLFVLLWSSNGTNANSSTAQTISSTAFAQSSEGTILTAFMSPYTFQPPPKLSPGAYPSGTLTIRSQSIAGAVRYSMLDSYNGQQTSVVAGLSSPVTSFELHLDPKFPPIMKIPFVQLSNDSVKAVPISWSMPSAAPMFFKIATQSNPSGEVGGFTVVAQ